MVKRPLLYAASAFIIGIIIYWQEINIGFLLLGFSIYYVILISLYRLKSISLKYDMFLIFLPILLLSGYIQMKDSMHACFVEYSYDKMESAVIEGVVVRIQRSKNKDKLYISSVKVISEHEPICCGEVMLYTDEYEGVQLGNTIQVHGKLSSFKPATNPGQFDEYSYYKSSGICAKMNAKSIAIINTDTAFIKIFLNNIKYKFTETFHTLFPEKEAGIIMAMILGEKAYMDEDIKELYQENGIAHILAVSGLHMSLIGMGFFNLLRKLKRSLVLSVLLSSFLICCYSYITGFGISAERAMIMLLMYLAAKLIGCTYDIISAVSLATIIILFKQPLVLFQAGFLLSFGAIFAIAFIYPIFIKLLDREKHKKLYPLMNSFMLSLSIQMVTIPIVLHFYFIIPIYGIFLNLIILPLMTLTASGAVIAGIVGFINLPLGWFISGGTYYILKFYELLCIYAGKLPYHQVVLGRPDKSQILLYYIFLAIIIIISLILKKKTLLFLLALTVIILKKGKPEGVEVAFLDVGQGDSIYVRNCYGTSFLFDGGSLDVLNVGKYRLKPFLLSQGIRKIDYVFISHTDLDHISGIIELMEYKMVSSLVLPKIEYKDEKYVQLECIANNLGISLLYFNKGSKLYENEFLIECYHPEKGMDFVDTNAVSMILEISFGSFSMMLTGDADKKAEIDAVRYRIDNMAKNNRVTVLKASHHGSNYSSIDEFISNINPLYTIISCGRYNSYGHPGINAIERLKSAGSSIYLTADYGAVMIKTDGYSVIIDTAIRMLYSRQ